MNFIDVHVHIDFYDNPQKIISEYEANKIYAIFVTNLPELFAKHQAKVRGLKYVRLALGFHPQVAAEYDFNRDLFDKYIKSTNYIGEVGLDLSARNKQTRDKQIEAFEYITSHPGAAFKIFSVHSRGAEKETLAILRKNGVKFAVFHWYSGPIGLIKEIIEAGYYLSVNHQMLNSEKGKTLLAAIPNERILIETDGPFIKVNGALVMPYHIPKTYKELQHFLQFPGIGEQIYANFRKLLIAGSLERLQVVMPETKLRPV